MIIKQRDYLEFCKCYLRNIEYRLADLGIPLEYFKNEGEVFHFGKPVYFRWSKEQFPHKVGQKVKGRLINIEKQIAVSLLFFWIFVLVLCITLRLGRLFFIDPIFA